MNKSSMKRYAILGVLLPALALSACSEITEKALNASTGSELSSQESAGNLPGASVDNTQRTWPDPSNLTDDSVHATPGQYSQDILGRPVWTPINHDGDLPEKKNLTQEFDSEKCGEVPELDGKTQIQYVNARYLVVNDLYGPAQMDEGVPSRYAHHPYGAVLAALNQFSYGTYGQEDEIGYKIDEKLWSSSKMVTKARKDADLDSKPPNPHGRNRSFLASSGARLLSCDKKKVTVEVALAYSDSTPAVVVRIPMVWKGKDWHADFSGNADKAMVQPYADTLDGFGIINYEGPQ